MKWRARQCRKVPKPAGRCWRENSRVEQTTGEGGQGWEEEEEVRKQRNVKGEEKKKWVKTMTLSNKFLFISFFFLNMRQRRLRPLNGTHLRFKRKDSASYFHFQGVHWQLYQFIFLRITEREKKKKNWREVGSSLELGLISFPPTFERLFLAL